MKNALLDILRIANREFQEISDQISQAGAKLVELPGAVRGLKKVERRLEQVSKHLVGSSLTAQAPEAGSEIAKYQENLKTLQYVLEILQSSLLMEKSLMDNARTHMKAASAWATSLRDIS